MEGEIQAGKELKCDFDGCDFLIRAATPEQVVELALDHFCFRHDDCEASPEIKDRLRSLVQDHCG